MEEGSSQSPNWPNTDSNSRVLNSSGLLSNRDQDHPRFSATGRITEYSDYRKESDKLVLANFTDQVGLSGVCEDEFAVDSFARTIEWGDISLRQWLDKLDRSVDAFDCLHIFRQIVDIVQTAHMQGIVVHNIRPSCFVMSSFNHVSFIESASCSDSGSDSSDDRVKDSSSLLPLDMQQQRSRMTSEDFRTAMAMAANARSEASCLQPRLSHDQAEETNQFFPMKQILRMETSWYSSPEEIAGGASSCVSDIYQLGVLLFELFCPLSSREEKCRTMSSLRHRVLPPQLLQKWPREASFCLWLLHPEPSSRPKISELLQSEFLNEPRDGFEEREAAIKLREKTEEQELLLEFLSLIQKRKQEAADKLQNTVSFLNSDIEEVAKHRKILKTNGYSLTESRKDDQSTSILQPISGVDNTDVSSSLGSRKRFRPSFHLQSTEECNDNLDDDDDDDDDEEEEEEEDMLTENQESVLSKSSRLMKNFKKLESAYFFTRSRPNKLTGRASIKQSPISSDGRGSVVSSVNNLSSRELGSDIRKSGWINPFLEGLCKYLSYSKLKVKADLNQGDLLNSFNLVCSLGFDRDQEFFATAGVNKKIKVFEYNTIINENRDIHYPVVEMASQSNLSSICWNRYIKSQIASSNFEGVVQVWDIARSQAVMELREHEKRAWSVDYSSADPTLLASGSNDGSVKLWSINQGVSVATIKTKANVCCVQFPLDTSRSLVFGSADHRLYCYDLRNSKVPLCTLVGHNKTVSYVKFLDNMNLVSSSTDNTVKLWDLSSCTSRVIDTTLQSFTGHTNVKNFVGLSVSDGYIATGSETNEVFIYHKAFPMPVLSFKFDSIDPLSGHEMEDAVPFISSVCWRGQSSTLVAANSSGNIKVLEMV
ncbi:hypothetical protein ACFE04_023294 [Oxalis oulophora]